MSKKYAKLFNDLLEKAITEFAAGKDVSWARVGPTSKIRRIAVYYDKTHGNDLEWARKNNFTQVRRSVAHADLDAGRDLLWAASDKSKAVREKYLYSLEIRGKN